MVASFSLMKYSNSLKRKMPNDLVDETEARWRLVETAWDMNLPNHL